MSPQLHSEHKRQGDPARQVGAVEPSPVRPDAGADDAALVAAARVDPRAFAYLYDRYVTRVYAYCLLRLGNREAAEDVTSEVFLRALTQLGSFRGSGPGGFAGWLFRIAGNASIDAQRRARQRVAAPLEAAEDVPDPDTTVEDLVVAASELTSLRQALQALPADQRAVLELQLAGLSPQEIAAALDRSLNAVRLVRLRAFRRMQPLLEAAGVERPTRGGVLPC